MLFLFIYSLADCNRNRPDLLLLLQCSAPRDHHSSRSTLRVCPSPLLSSPHVDRLLFTRSNIVDRRSSSLPFLLLFLPTSPRNFARSSSSAAAAAANPSTVHLFGFLSSSASSLVERGRSSRRAHATNISGRTSFFPLSIRHLSAMPRRSCLLLRAPIPGLGDVDDGVVLCAYSVSEGGNLLLLPPSLRQNTPIISASGHAAAGDLDCFGLTKSGGRPRTSPLQR